MEVRIESVGVESSADQWHETHHDIFKPDAVVVDHEATRDPSTAYKETMLFDVGAIRRADLEAKLNETQQSQAQRVEIPRMDPASESELAKIDPQLADRVRLMAAELKAQGINVVVAPKGGLRTFAEQDELYAQGRTKPGNIVTHVRGGESYHNYGLAVDIVPTNAQGKPTWQASREVWEAIGRAGERQGLEWGGRWTGFSDVPHFQFAGPTKAAKELLPIYKQGGLQAVWDYMSRYYPKLDYTPIARQNTATTINGVPSYAQNDPRWAKEPYGLNPQLGSFGENGCTVTAAAIVAQWASGRTFTPSMANNDWAGTLRQFKYEDLSGRGVTFGNAFPAVDRNSPAAQDLLEKIRNSVRSGHPVVLGISGGVVTPDSKTWGRHTVVVVGVAKNGELLVNDPATGQQQVPLSKFQFKKFDMAFAISKRDGSGGTVSQPVTPTPSRPTSGVAVPTARLERGSTGPQVEMLQRALVKLGYMTQAEMDTGPGIFGPRTERALREFQQAHGLEVDGIYGPKTREALRRALEKPEAPTARLERGSTGSQVEMLQRALVRLGYMTQEQMNTGPGIFGPRTEAALRAFQRDHGLEVDGIYGPRTQAALRRALEKEPSAPPAPPTASINRLPKTVEEANKFFKTQFLSQWNVDGPSSSKDCGPASLEMALEAVGLRPASHRQKSIDEARQAMGVPPGTETNTDQVVTGAKRFGAEVTRGSGWEALDQTLASGKAVVAAGDITAQYVAGFGGQANYGHSRIPGHFIAIVGRTEDGRYIVADPMSRNGAVAFTRKQLSEFFKGANNAGTGEPTNFVAIGNPTKAEPTAPPSSISQQAARIDEILRRTGLEGKGEVIARLAQQYRVPPELALAMFRKEASFAKPGTLAARNNNPGNIKYVGQEGAVEGERGFAKWATMDEGIEAFFKLLNKEPYRRWLDQGDYRSIIFRYAPPSENDSELYLKQILDWMKEYRQKIATS